MFAYDILAKTRTLIDAKESGYAAGNTFNHTSNCRAKGASRLAALLRPLSRATSNPLRLGRKRQSKQPSHAISETPQHLGGPCYGANSRMLCRKGGSSQYAQQCRILASYFLHVFDPRERHSHVEPLVRALCLAWLLSGDLRPYGDNWCRASRFIVGEHGQ